MRTDRQTDEANSRSLQFCKHSLENFNMRKAHCTKLHVLCLLSYHTDTNCHQRHVTISYAASYRRV